MSSGNHGKPGKSGKKVPCNEKSWNLTKLPVAGKLAVRHTKLVCLTASFLANGGFKF